MKKNAFIRESFDIAGIPLLVGYTGSRDRAAEQGTICLYHGLYSCKEVCLDLVTMLAEAGYCAVAVDAVGHGAREGADPHSQIQQGSSSFQRDFCAAIVATADEFPQLYAGLKELGLVQKERVGLCGVSMGGGVVYELLVRDYPVEVAVPLISSPAFAAWSSASPALHPEAVFPIALLTMTAGMDDTVPPEAARAFHAALAPFYKSAPERLAEVRYPDSEHLMREEDWEDARRRTVAWISRFL